MSKELMERAQYLLRNNPYAVHNHIFVTELEEEWCEGYLEVEDDVLNVYGIPHGAAYFSLADVLAGMVLRGNGHHFVTQTAASHFIGTTKEKRLYGRAALLKRGRGTAVLECRITDSSGKLLFFSTFDYFNMEGRVKVVETAPAPDVPGDAAGR